MPPRKLADTAHISLRIKESLRRKLELEAKRHHTSLNNEIRWRLEDSFTEQDRRGHDQLNHDVEVLLARYARHLTRFELEQDLAQALAKTKDPEVAKLAVAWLATRDKHLSGGTA